MSEMIMGVDFGAEPSRPALTIFKVTPEGKVTSDDWVFYDEAQNMRTWPCLGSRRHAYATGARGIVECAECGKLWTMAQLVGGLIPYHAGTRRTARRQRRKDRAARKRRRGW